MFPNDSYSRHRPKTFLVLSSIQTTLAQTLMQSMEHKVTSLNDVRGRALDRFSLHMCCCFDLLLHPPPPRGDYFADKLI